MIDHPTDAALLAEIRQELAAAMAARPWEAEERARYGFTLAEYQAALVAEVQAELAAILGRPVPGAAHQTSRHATASPVGRQKHPTGTMA